MLGLGPVIAVYSGSSSWSPRAHLRGAPLVEMAGNDPDRRAGANVRGRYSESPVLRGFRLQASASVAVAWQLRPRGPHAWAVTVSLPGRSGSVRRRSNERTLRVVRTAVFQTTRRSKRRPDRGRVRGRPEPQRCPLEGHAPPQRGARRLDNRHDPRAQRLVLGSPPDHPLARSRPTASPPSRLAPASAARHRPPSEPPHLPAADGRRQPTVRRLRSASVRGHAQALLRQFERVRSCLRPSRERTESARDMKVELLHLDGRPCGCPSS